MKLPVGVVEMALDERRGPGRAARTAGGVLVVGRTGRRRVFLGNLAFALVALAVYRVRLDDAS